MSSSSGSSSSSSTSSVALQSSASSSAACRRGVTLRRSAQTRMYVNGVDSFRFQVLAHEACGMPAAIFRFLRYPYDAVTETQKDEFDGVCSAPDLEEFPENEPQANAVPPYFRRDQIDLLLRSQHDADEAWTLIQEDVRILVETLQLQDTLAVQEEVRFEVGE